MVDQPVVGAGSANMDRLLQSIENEAGGSRRADLPANDPAGIGINHKSHIDEPCPSVDLGEVDHPQGIGPADAELAVDLVRP